jgi:hypothetical protein
MVHPNDDLVREGYAAFGRGDLDMLSNRFSPTASAGTSQAAARSAVITPASAR